MAYNFVSKASLSCSVKAGSNLRYTTDKKDISPTGRHDKLPPPSVGHGARTAVGHAVRFALVQSKVK